MDGRKLWLGTRFPRGRVPWFSWTCTGKARGDHVPRCLTPGPLGAMFPAPFPPVETTRPRGRAGTLVLSSRLRMVVRARRALGLWVFAKPAGRLFSYRAAYARVSNILFFLLPPRMLGFIASNIPGDCTRGNRHSPSCGHQATRTSPRKPHVQPIRRTEACLGFGGRGALHGGYVDAYHHPRPSAVLAPRPNVLGIQPRRTSRMRLPFGNASHQEGEAIPNAGL